MGGAARAFFQEFRDRLRWGLIALAVYFVLMALAGLATPGAPFDRGSVAFAFTVPLPLSFAFMYLLAVFSYGLAGDLTARHSLYPARLFSLPVSTAALAGWPMLYGATALAVFWLLSTVVVLWPAGVPVPLVWPALFGAGFLAWMQVLTWMPYGLPGMRVIAAVVWLTMIDAVVLVAMEFEVSEWWMAAIMAPQVPLAYLAARHAVGRARRGEVPDWRGLFAALAGRMDVRSGAGFVTAARAQLWVEWRQHGLALPGWTATVLPFLLLLLFVVRHEPAVLTFVTLAGMLLTPPFLAAFVAVTVGRSSPEAGHAFGLTPFLATRPLTTADLAAAKLRMAMASTLVAWALVLTAIPIGLTVAGSWSVVADETRRLVERIGAPRTAVLAALGVLALVATTWKQLAQGLTIGLTGREALIKGSSLARLCSLILVGPALHLLARSTDAQIALFNALPWIPAVFVGFKLTAAGWIFTRLSRHRLVSERALVAVAASWLLAVLVLDGVLVWIWDTPHVPHYFLLLLSILAVPLARPSALPLALAWNRHRGTAASTPPAAGSRRPPVALACLALPLGLAVVTWVSFYARNRHNGGFVSSGEEREYLLHVPKSYDPTRPTPLVISMHGGGLWGAVQMEMSQWNEVADEHGFLVVYPSGAGSGGPRAWRASHDALTSKDVRFIGELIDTLSRSYAIDPTRLYADGLSNGGGMAFALSCAMPDRIAAVGLVASAHFLEWSRCRGQRPVPMIAFHGTDDRATPYHGGKSWVTRRFVFPSIPTFTANWARRNRCQPTATESQVAPDVSRLTYGSCADDADVVLYTIHGGGHTWPGGGPQPTWFAGRTSTSINASRQAWEFFRAHPLRQR